MNLQPTIPSSLWAVVQSPYETENYSHAILEATYLLSGVLRERAGVDGDGTSLVGQALGGDDPKLKLNAFQSESERNEQKGFEQILRGVYVGIRNPRSHEQTTDDKESADAILHFIGYIIKRLNASKATFTIDGFLARVLDSEFVESVRYAELLVAEIPKLRLSDCLIGIYQERKKIELRKLRFLIPTLLNVLTPPQLSAYMNVVSEELRTATEDSTIRTSLQMLTPEVWPSISELPRLRIENKLVQGIRQGEVLTSGKTTQALATWSKNLLKAFTTRSEVANALISRLEDQDADARHYVAKYFMRILPDVMSAASHKTRCIRAIVAAVSDDDANVRSKLIGAVLLYPVEWQMELAKELKEMTDESNPAVHLADGIPFLSAPAKDEFDEEIPF